MALTSEQQLAVDERNCNLLVSAAAGSGKTSVLITRIVDRVLDKNNPVDIDKIVVVTFTKAAAEEMKSRLVGEFEKKLKENPGDIRIIKQISLTDHAKITTIDSFCTYILRNYYNYINYNPSYRVADKGELELLKADVYSELFEEKLAKNDANFINAVESYAPGKSLDEFFDIVKNLQEFSESHPWPKDWLNSCFELYNIKTKDDFLKAAIVKNTLKNINIILDETLATYNKLLEMCNENAELEPYTYALLSDIEFVKKCKNSSTYDEYVANFHYKFESFKRITKCTVPELKEQVMNARTELKKQLGKLKTSFFSQTSDEIIADICNCEKNVKALVEFTLAYSERLLKEKEDRGIASFSDIEHRTLEILVKRENGIEEYTEVADELSKAYEEIYIDEYQDSNNVQEKILTAISRCRFGENNIFMVGDVKQSIYRFRMANPALFIDKYDRYTNEPSKERKIELHTNFRSTQNVIDTVNDVFYRVMHKSVGDIEYTDDAALNYGGDKPDVIDTTTEFCYMSKEKMDEYGVDNPEVYAYMACKSIDAIMKKHPGLKYSDFVILLRSDKKTGLQYADTLNYYGIPAVFSSSTGYFSAYEVTSVINLLRVIDNPRQDIPLAATMRSFFAYFTAEELATIKGKKRKTDLIDCVREYVNREDELAKKCEQFIEKIEIYRKNAGILTISELITDIVYNSGFYDYVGLLKNGSTRKRNLDMLLTRASEYEKTSYSGLFNFIRYIEKIKKYDVDYGESKGLDKSNDYVKIMSIHQSKGLQFPIVILGDSSKKYNMRDLNKSIIIDSDYGIGTDCIDLDRRVKSKPVIKEMIRHKMECDAVGEELRILYVALTRAVQKLVVLGIAEKKDMEIIDSKDFTMNADMEYILSNPKYQSLLLPVIKDASHKAKYNIIEYQPEEIISELKNELSDNINFVTGFYDSIRNFEDEEMGKKVKKQLEYVYPYESINGLKSKYSVSELKHSAMVIDIKEPESIKPMPVFLRDESEVTGTLRGTAYHKFFEIFDYDRCKDEVSINTYFEECISTGKLPLEYKDLINTKYFERFVETDLGRRMGIAFKNKVLFREQPFIMEVDANEVDTSYPDSEKVLVQGIVDAFFFEGEKVYIVDYKTDRVDNDTELVERYKKQLELYMECLKKVTGMEVGACYIYSTYLNKEINILD